MTLFWDRQNRPIENVIDWAVMFEDPAFRVVACDQDAPGTPMVSTIWQGLAQGAPLHVTDDTALIFETAFLINGHVEQQWWDHSEEQALHRHRMVCLSMLGREPRPEDGLVQMIIDNEREAKG
jgi:hypothetical protein